MPRVEINHSTKQLITDHRQLIKASIDFGYIYIAGEGVMYAKDLIKKPYSYVLELFNSKSLFLVQVKL
jgi:hypothetical protein